MAIEINHDFLKAYKSYQMMDSYAEQYKWGAYKLWTNKWNWKADDKVAMLNQCFNKDGAENLWQSKNFYPVTMLIDFLKVNEKESVEMIDHLLDESIDLNERIVRLKSDANAVLKKYNEESGNEHKHHYIGDRFGSLLLSLEYPDRYAYYKYGVFKSFMSSMEMPPPKKGASSNYTYFMESINGIVAQVKQNVDFYTKYQSDLKLRGEFEDKGLMLLAQDLMYVEYQKLRNAKSLTEQNKEETDPNTPKSENVIISKSENNNQAKKQSTFPLNQIFYGPPGTGKTYETITRALEILGVDYSSGDRVETVKLYNSHVQNKNIAFVTFHQSMGYEDFIEGIKPVFSEDDGGDVVDAVGRNLEYSIKPGIFMKMCAMAAFENYKQKQSAELITFDQLYDRYIGDLRKRIDAGNPKRILTKTGYPIILERINRNDSIITIYGGGENPSRSRPKRKEHLRILYSKIDSVDELNTVKEIGSIIGTRGAMSSYYAVFKDLKEFEKSLDTSTIDTDEEGEDTLDIIMNFKTGEYNNVDFDNSSPKKVLIIDEINRANVSSIFGELITLLEDDKRVGNINQITTALPYSPDATFGVPKNLYIIGTMNTADRSVEALDTALRRRFTFIEKMPDPSIIDSDSNLGKSEIGGLKLSSVLTVINQRIAALVDRDHTIGHSYFMNIHDENELRLTFKNKIIPLLQEYFYNDYYKLLLVLGSGFVKEEKVDNQGALFAIENVELDLSDRRYDLIPLEDGFKIIEAVRILMKLSKPDNG